MNELALAKQNSNATDRNEKLERRGRCCHKEVSKTETGLIRLWFQYEMSTDNVDTWEAVQPWGGGASLEEVGHQRQALQVIIAPISCLKFSTSCLLRGEDQPPPQAPVTMAHEANEQWRQISPTMTQISPPWKETNTHLNMKKNFREAKSIQRWTQLHKDVRVGAI